MYFLSDQSSCGIFALNLISAREEKRNLDIKETNCFNYFRAKAQNNHSFRYIKSHFVWMIFLHFNSPFHVSGVVEKSRTHNFSHICIKRNQGMSFGYLAGQCYGPFTWETILRYFLTLYFNGPSILVIKLVTSLVKIISIG